MKLPKYDTFIIWYWVDERLACFVALTREQAVAILSSYMTSVRYYPWLETIKGAYDQI